MPERKGNAIVTGAARGIGRTIALHLAGAGYNVAISDILEADARSTANEVEALGVSARVVRTDVSSEPDVEALIQGVNEAWGSVDVLVNNAGVTRDNLLVRMSQADWDLVLDINLKGAFLCSREAAKVMMRQRSGRMVNIASVAGLMGTAGQANYAASKAGLIAMTKTMARELGGRNVTVNAIAPGFIITEMTDQLSDKVKEGYLSQIPLRRGGTPQDIADAVGFLVSPAAGYITGTVINVSGGLVM
ncbi:MAG: 3-oxoacyl-[acyl-carrier-protein] reductase [Acidobacteriota bacterium]|jgi:3-oxoacyl-[acyl-carrier protein] reductase|nr:3-oxoacyl-[acyl-carrier-protein] reductase [Acidobacteriota bacterium]